MSTLPKKAKKPAANPLKKLSLIQKWLLLVGLFVLIFSTFPAVLIILIGLLPSITIIITDPRNTNKLTIVGCFNLTGVFICLSSLINQINIPGSFSVINNIFNLIIMLGCSAFGVILYYELPNFFVMMSKVSSQKRIKNIDNRLEKLALDWGQESIKSSK